MRISAYLYGNKEYGVCKNGAIYSRKSGKWKKMTPCANSWGYYVFVAHIDGVRKTYKLHRVIGDHFVKNADPSKFNQIHHKNENKDHNAYKNLKWIDNKGNNAAKTKPFKNGKIDAEIKMKIKRDRVEDKSGCVLLARKYGVSINTAHRAIKDI